MIPLIPVVVLGALGYGAYKLHKAAPMKASATNPVMVAQPTIPGYAAPSDVVAPTGYASESTPTYDVAPGDVSILVQGRFTVTATELLAANGLTGSNANSFIKGAYGKTIKLPMNAKDNGPNPAGKGANGTAHNVAEGITAKFNIPGLSDTTNNLLRMTAARGDAGALQQMVENVVQRINYMSVPGDTVVGIRMRFNIPNFFSPDVNNAAAGGIYTYKVGTKNMNILLPLGAYDSGSRPGATGTVKKA